MESLDDRIRRTPLLLLTAMNKPLTADVFYGWPPTLSLIPVSH